MSGGPLDPVTHPLVEVVGAAIVRQGCVLAARRTTPPEVAGRWEFPGGKVEIGEQSAQALAREIYEELGCEIRVDAWLDGESEIDDSHVLRVAVATLLAGDPTPIEHDGLRWLTAETLHEVDWLGPDRRFLTELKRILLDG